MNERPVYSALIAERRRLLAKLGDWPPILRGSLRRHKNRCGNPACRCHDPDHPVLHGPYHYLSHRHENRTQTILLTESKRPYAQAWVSNYRRLIRTIHRLAEVNFRILRYHHNQLGQKR